MRSHGFDSGSRKSSLPAWLSIALVIATLGWAQPTRAQTLTVEIEGEIALESPDPAPDGVRAPDPQLDPARPSPVIVVAPPDDSPSSVRVAEPVRPYPQPTVAAPRVVTVAPPPTERRNHDDEPIAAFGVGFAVEWVDLSALALTLDDPEIESTQGLRIPANHPVLRMPVASVGLSFGVSSEWFRGPEIRLFAGGGTEDHDRIDEVGGFGLAAQNLTIFRGELAVGIQPRFGAFRPYILGIASLGVAWIDVGVSHPLLGELGTETPELLLANVGLEAGAEFEVEDGVLLGASVRATFAETSSLGGTVWTRFTIEDE